MQALEDPNEVVLFRVPKNETTPRFRHLALNAEGIRYLNECTSVVHSKLSEQEQLKFMIIAQLCESEAVLDELSSSSYSSDSSSSLSLSSGSSSSDDDEVFMLEDAIMHLCVMYNISCTLVDGVIIELFNFTALTREEINSVGTEFEPKKNESFDNICDKTLYKWTRFTSTKLYQLKSYFFEEEESELIEIVHRDNTRSKWTIEHIMLIALTYQATGESYSSMVLKFGG